MLLLMIIIMIIMNMQNNLYTIQSSHLPMTNVQSVPEQRSQNPEITDFVNFAKLKKTTKLLDKRGLEPIEKRKKRESCTWASPHS